jgi:3',5'-cyclic AMP phosphodiesterase CpdA
MAASHGLRQVEILHLSDLHFGERHRFDPARAVTGGALASRGTRSLFDKLNEDLSAEFPTGLAPFETGGLGTANCPVLVCLSGDFTQTGTFSEFAEAEKFIRDVAASQHVQAEGLKRIFIVPGNHDVLYEKSDIGERWQQYVEFYNRLYGTRIPITEPWQLDVVHDRVDDLGAIVVCVNSAIYVTKGSKDQHRGQVDEAQLDNLHKQLKAIKESRRRSAIRIAMVHHHPILVPPLAEADRNYDAIERSGQLLNLLHDFGFHVLLHGHKHLPLSLLDDQRNAFEVTRDRPLVVVAGGSVGSTGLPDQPGRCNCYNLIKVKWNPEAGQSRVHITTRGLVTHADNGQSLPRPQWGWKTIREDDRAFAQSGFAVRPTCHPQPVTVFNKEAHGESNGIRHKMYDDTRCNLPVVEVRPSLNPKHAYEACFWIETHDTGHHKHETPARVVWSAGEKFPVITIEAEKDCRFCGTFDYWGPMLIQAELHFKDGEKSHAHVYAHVPGRNPHNQVK